MRIQGQPSPSHAGIIRFPPMPLDWSPLWQSLRYAALATLFAAILALPLAWLLARRPFPGSELLDAIASLPLIIPPAVLVYYLLAASGHWRIAFNWHAAIPLSAVYTLPLLLRMTRSGLQSVDPHLLNAARGLGAGEWRTFWRITLPLASPALLGALLAAFARSFADFGATVVVAQNVRIVWILPIAALSLAALYCANRLRRSLVPA